MADEFKDLDEKEQYAIGAVQLWWEENEDDSDGLVTKSTHHNKVTSNEDNTSWKSAYLSDAIRSTLNLHCIWHLVFDFETLGMLLSSMFDVDEITANASGIVGITSKPDTTGPFHRNREDVNYAYYPGKEEKLRKYNITTNYGNKLQDDEKVKFLVTVDLNLRNGRLGFWLNGEYQGLAYNVVRSDDIEYTLACSLCGDASIELLSSRIMVPSEDISYVKEQLETEKRLRRTKEQRIVDLDKKERDLRREFKEKIKKKEQDESNTELRYEQKERQLQEKIDELLKKQKQLKRNNSSLNKQLKAEKTLRQKKEEQILTLQKKEVALRAEFEEKIATKEQEQREKEKELQQMIDDLVKRERKLELRNSILRLPLGSPVLAPWNLHQKPWFNALPLDDIKIDDNDDDDGRMKNKLSVMRYIRDPNKGCWHMLKMWKNGDITGSGFVWTMGEKLAASGFKKFGETVGAGVGGVIGGLIGGVPLGILGIAIGFLLGKAAELVGTKIWNFIFPPEKTDEQKLFEEALEMFDFEKEDIHYPHKFNERTIKDKYNKMLRKGQYKHPNYGGNNEKCAHLIKCKEMLMETFPEKSLEKEESKNTVNAIDKLLTFI